jgi:hypothetical protein
MRSVAPAPCIALEPDRYSADIQSFESELRRRIVGQDHAIDSLGAAERIDRAYRASPKQFPVLHENAPLHDDF